MWRTTARLGAVLGCLVMGIAVAASPAAAARGVTVEITELSERFEAGASAPAQMTVVARKRTGDCFKIRWRLVLRVEDMNLDQLRVDRREEDGSFPVDVQTTDDELRLTDEQLDPGTLCRNRTVTARYTLAFAEDSGEGRVTLRVEAYDTGNDLLESATETRNIAVDPDASPTPSREPSEEASAPAEAPVAGGGVGQPIEPASGSGGSGLLPVGLAIGGMMVFLGLTLLLRARRRLVRARPVGRPGMTGEWRGGGRTVRQRR